MPRSEPEDRGLFRGCQSGSRGLTPQPLARTSAEVAILNPSTLNQNGLPVPGEIAETPGDADRPAMHLVEIPADFMKLKNRDPELGLAWRLQTRGIFTSLFAAGYLVTDFVHLPGKNARSFYVFSHGESTL